MALIPPNKFIISGCEMIKIEVFVPWCVWEKNNYYGQVIGVIASNYCG